MTEAVAWMYERRPEAYPPTKMLVALERRLDISELQFWTETPLYPAEADQGGWIVGNGDGTKWRTWGAMGPEWTTDRNTATRYYRREDAEAVHRDDEDAWTIVPFSDQGPQASTEAAWCDDTLPCARYTEALRARDEKIAELERERETLSGLVQGWHYLAVGPDEMGDYHTQKQLIKLSEPYASPALKTLKEKNDDA